MAVAALQIRGTSGELLLELSSCELASDFLPKKPLKFQIQFRDSTFPAKERKVELNKMF